MKGAEEMRLFSWYLGDRLLSQTDHRIHVWHPQLSSELVWFEQFDMMSKENTTDHLIGLFSVSTFYLFEINTNYSERNFISLTVKQIDYRM